VWVVEQWVSQPVPISVQPGPLLRWEVLLLLLVELLTHLVQHQLVMSLEEEEEWVIWLVDKTS